MSSLCAVGNSMTDLLWAGVLVGLVAFGFADSMALRAGPFGLAGWVRRRMQQASRPAWVQEGADCVFCWGFWGAAGAALLLLVWIGTLSSLGEMVVVWLVGAGVNAFLAKYVGH